MSITQNNLRQRRIAQHLCRDCGLRSPIEGKVICLSCFTSRSKRQSKRKATLIASTACLQCGNKAREGKTLCQSCMNNQVQGMRETRKRNKLAIINYFGNKCNRCGENHIATLTLHHINKDGNKDKINKNGKRIITPTWYAKLYKELIATSKLRNDLELLCYNCHAKEDLMVWWLK